MKIDELIEHLNTIKEEKGDMEIGKATLWNSATKKAAILDIEDAPIEKNHTIIVGKERLEDLNEN